MEGVCSEHRRLPPCYPASVCFGAFPMDDRIVNCQLLIVNYIKECIPMELSQILAKCDHTLLAQTATWADIKLICDDGMKYKTASVCIPASFVKQAKGYGGNGRADRVSG